jgi:hypothetical protein
MKQIKWTKQDQVVMQSIGNQCVSVQFTVTLPYSALLFMAKDFCGAVNYYCHQLSMDVESLSF